MCLICIEFQRGKLTIPEAERNLGETVEALGDHAEEVLAMLWAAEDERDTDDTHAES